MDPFLQQNASKSRLGRLRLMLEATATGKMRYFFLYTVTTNEEYEVDMDPCFND